jgi:START domain-containing protein
MHFPRLPKTVFIGTARSLVLAIGMAVALPAIADSPQAPASEAAATPPAAPAAAAPAPAAPVAWEKIGDDDGVAVYKRDVPGSPLVAFKGEGVVNASILRVASVLVDSKRATEWIDRLVEARDIRMISETESIHYDHVATPIVMKDRDFVSDVKLEFSPAEKKMSLKIHAVTDPAAPTTNYVRGELLHSAFVLTSIEHGTKTRVVAEIHADPKGSVAKWIVNLFQRSWPHNTITRLRAQVAKPDIQDHPRLKQVFTDNGYLN